MAVYWLLAFAIAFCDYFYVSGNDLPWWDVAIFRVPGFHLGLWIFELLEQLPGVNYSVILNDYLVCFLGVLCLVAINIGWVTWLVSHKLVYSWVARNEINKIQ